MDPLKQYDSLFIWKSRGKTLVAPCRLSCLCWRQRQQLNGLSHPSQLGSTHWPTFAPRRCCSSLAHFKCITDGTRAFAWPFVTQAPSGRVALRVSAQIVKPRNHRRTECNLVLIWLLFACQRVKSHSRYRTSHGCHHSLHKSDISGDLSLNGEKLTQSLQVSQTHTNNVH